MPEGVDVRPWMEGFVGQTGQLSIANDRGEAVIHIFTTCEANANAARPRKKFLGIF